MLPEKRFNNGKTSPGSVPRMCERECFIGVRGNIIFNSGKIEEDEGLTENEIFIKNFELIQERENRKRFIRDFIKNRDLYK